MATIVKYENFQKLILEGTVTVDWDTDAIKTMLVTSSYTPSAANHDYIDDAVANEVTGTNYTADGFVHTVSAPTQASGTATVDMDDATWAQHASGFTNARYAIIYKDTGTTSTSPVFGYIDMTSDRGNVDGSLTLQWAGTGVFTQG